MLAPYLSLVDEPHDILNKYHAKILLSNAMVSTLHNLELYLQDFIDKVIRKHYIRIGEQNLLITNLLLTRVTP
jgi:hypothetical protein